MLLVPLLAILGTSAPFAANINALADEASEPPADNSSDPHGDEVLRHLEAAQTALSEGRIEDAIESAESAIDTDRSFAGAYLMRAQVLFEGLGNLEHLPTEGESIDPRWPGWARRAAADIKLYLELTGIDGDAGAQFEAQRTRLLEAASTLEEALARHSEDDSDEVEDSAPPPVIEDPPPPLSRRDLGLVLAGSVLAVGGVSLLSVSVRIEPQCMGTNCVDAEWRRQVPFLAPGFVAAIGGAGLVTTGAVLLARRGHASTLRRRRIIGSIVLASAGAAVLGSAVLGSTASGRFARTDPNDADGLSTTQSMANAAFSLGAAVPSLLGGGIGLMLRPRPSSRR